MTRPTLRTALSSACWIIMLLLGGWALRVPSLNQQQWNIDEACTFTMAQQVRDGGVLYRDAVDHRGPLVPYLKAAVFAVAGDWNVHAVRVSLALALGVVAWLLRSLARRWGDGGAGNAASIIFLVLSVVLAGTGDAFAAHTEWFVVLFSTLGFWFLSGAGTGGSIGRGFVIGAMFGAGALCKQPGILDLGVTWVLLALWGWWHPVERARLVRLWAGSAAGALAVAAAAAAYFWHHGVLRDFVYYAWQYNVEIYLPEVSRWERLATVRIPFVLAATHAPALGLLAVVGTVKLVGCAKGMLWRRPGERSLFPWLILGWCASGLISLELGGRGFDHYSLQLIPGLSLAAGWSVARCLDWMRERTGTRMRNVLVGATVLLGAAVLTAYDLRKAYRNLPMPEGKGWFELQKLVQRYSTPTDPVFVWGYYPDGYLLSRRPPATRFINANFLTGMVPWSNLEYERDTRYAIVPDAWDAFWRDYREHPPAVILETRERGYIKYPLLAQARLRDDVIDHFARIDRAATDPFQVWILRRLVRPDRDVPAQLSPDPKVRIETRPVDRVPDVLEVSVFAPNPGATVVLRVAGRPYRQLHLPEGAAAEVDFFVRVSDLGPGDAGLIDAIVFDGRKALASAPVNLYRRYRLDPEIPAPSPVLRYGREQINSAAAEPNHWLIEPRNNVLGWRTDAPFRLEFPRQPGIQVVSWIWQPAPLHRGAAEMGDPKIPEVSLVTDHGAEPLVSRLTAAETGQWLVSTELPPKAGGQIRFEWSGAHSPDRTSTDVWLAELNGFAHGPPLNFPDRALPPFDTSTSGDAPWTLNPDHSWTGRAPARLVFPRPAHLNSLVCEYSRSNPGASAATPEDEDFIFDVNFVHRDGRSENLRAETIAPKVDRPSRHRMRKRIELPEDAPGKIELRFNPTAQTRQSDDRVTLYSLRAQGPGPDLVISDDRVLVPIDSLTRGIEQIHTFVDGRWIAHTPGYLVYACPPDLRAVSFGFGIDQGAYRGPDGRRLTNGVEIIAEFRDDEEKSTELYRRYLDPYQRPGDRGAQQARIELPGRRGRLVFHLTPGEFNDASYDWSYWTDFTGESE